MFDVLRDWLPALGVLGAAIIAGLTASFGNMLLFRRSGQDIQLKTQTTAIESEKVVVLDKEADTHERSELRESFQTAIDFHLKVIANLDHEVTRLAAGLEACLAREAASAAREAATNARLDHMEAWAREHGYVMG